MTVSREGAKKPRQAGLVAGLKGARDHRRLERDVVVVEVATPGAALAPGLHVPHASLILRKGCNPEVDSYSAFTEADGTSTGLAAWLRARGITRVVLAGLATDYCVAWSALDARRAGFTTAVAEDACRAIDLNNSLAAAWAAMTQAGITRIQTTQATPFPAA